MDSTRPSRPHVLIVDDCPDDLRLMVETLRAANFRITVAFDGAQGYKRAIAVMPDIILMDVRMPGADGFVACRLLKSDPITKDIPLIFLTASHELESRLAGLQNGAVDFVIKPFEPAEVMARIRIHLRKSGLPAPHSPPQPRPRLGPDQVIVNAAVTYLKSTLSDPPELKTLARKVGTYEKKLSGAFRRVLGTTVFEFMRDERLNVAQRLLIETDLTVTDIAAEVGFSTAANFATAFRKSLGVTPSIFRERELATRDRLPKPDHAGVGAGLLVK